MEDGRYAESQAEQAIENILGIELLGIGFDCYDSSFEIYPWEECDLAPTPEQHAAILALGCLRYWINFPDDTEIYSGGQRKPAGSPGRHDRFNRGTDEQRSKESARVELEQALRECCDAMKEMSSIYPWIWDRADGAATVFPEHVPRLEDAFEKIDAAWEKARSLVDRPKNDTDFGHSTERPV
jgi:hypothetical protein